MNALDSDGDEVLGRGLAFPLQLQGGVVGLNGHDGQIAQSIGLILRTAQGERVMRPAFGAGTEQLAFEPLGAVTASLVQHRIREALQRFEPRIEVLEVTPQPPADEGVMCVDVRYRIKRTAAIGSLVYPFYLERGEG